MNSGKSSRRVRSLCATALVVMVAAVGVAPRRAQAQMATVESGPSLFSHIMNQLNTLTQRLQDSTAYVEEKARWASTWSHYYQQVARFMSQVSSPTLQNTVAFQEVPMDYGVAERCGGTGGFSFSLSSLANTLLPGPNADIVASQKKICAQIQMLENQKFNVTVRYFKQVAPILKRDLDAITAQRKANNEQGTLQAISEASDRLQNQQQTSGAELENQLKSCDQLIAVLTETQKNLARQALNGKPDTAIGTLVKTATLEAALKAK